MTKRIDSLQERYLLATILDVNDERCEDALEKFCSLVRAGHRPNNPVGFGRALGTLLFNPKEKLRRWAFNAIALVGKRTGSEFIEVLQTRILSLREDSFLLRYAIAAYFAVSRDDDEAYQWLKANDVPMEPSSLMAASPFSKRCEADLHRFRLNIDTADAYTLQNAAILVGINKMPDGVFSGKHPYKHTIGKLNLHDDKHVKQYSFWAVQENPLLSVADMGIVPAEIDALEVDVKKWAYHSLGADTEYASKHRDILEHASLDKSSQVRQNLARGIVNTFFAGMEDWSHEWFANETDPEVKTRLLEHMAANSNYCPAYVPLVLEQYMVSSASDRMRLEIAAARTPLHGDIRRLQFSRDSDLFNFNQPPTGGPLLMIDNSTKTFVNNSQSTVSVSGNNSGNLAVGANAWSIVQDTVSQTQDLKLRDILNDVLVFVDSHAKNDKQCVEAVQAVATQPTRSTVEKLITVLGGYAAVGNAAILTGKLLDWAKDIL